MGPIKTFLLGLGAAYSIYFITKKGPDGRSILDELLTDPEGFMRKAKEYAVQDTLKVIKEELGK